MTNIRTAIGQGCSDSVPMLVISSANATGDLGRGRGRLHEISDQRAVSEPLTGASAMALRSADIPEFIVEAFSSLASAQPRPMHLSVPIDLFGSPAKGDWEPGAMAPAPVPEAALVRAARERLANARKPVILLGGGASGVPRDSLLRLVGEAGTAVVSNQRREGHRPRVARLVARRDRGAPPRNWAFRCR